MRPIQYASNTPFVSTADIARPTHRPNIVSRALSGAMTALLVSVGTFAIFWMIAMVTATLMVRG